MKWPWGRNLTTLQAVEVGKFCLNLCQTTLIGTLGVFYVSEFHMYVRAILAMSGMIISVLLFFLAIKLFEGGKRYGIHS